MTPDPDSISLPPGTVVSRSPYLTSGGLAVFDGKTIAVSDLDCFRLHAGGSVKALDLSSFVFDPKKPIDCPMTDAPDRRTTMTDDGGTHKCGPDECPACWGTGGGENRQYGTSWTCSFCNGTGKRVGHPLPDPSPPAPKGRRR